MNFSIEENYIKDLVSIVIPTYNQSDFIAEAIASVLAQSYTNIEIIISDDGSEDGTTEIIKDFAKKDKRIRYFFSINNNGIPFNFNRAFDNVKGEYVAFLGGDDIMYPNKIEKQVLYLKENPHIVLVQSDMGFLDSETDNIFKKLSDEAPITTDPLAWALRVEWDFQKKVMGALPSACLARSEYYLSARYTDQLKLKHELLFTVECYNNYPEGEWGVIPEVLGIYRIHEKNYSRSHNSIRSIVDENFKLAELVRQRCPLLIDRVNEFEFFTSYKVLLFRAYSNDKEKERAQKVFCLYSGNLQKICLKIGQVLVKIKLLGLYLKLTSLTNCFKS